MQQSGGLLLVSGSTLTTPLFSFPDGNENANKSLLLYYAVTPHPNGWGFSFWRNRDLKGRPERSEGKKVSGGHFLSPWENPSVFRRSPQDCE